MSHRADSGIHLQVKDKIAAFRFNGQNIENRLSDCLYASTIVNSEAAAYCTVTFFFLLDTVSYSLQKLNRGNQTDFWIKG